MPNKNERVAIRDKFPMAYAFGDERVKFLSAEEAAQASPQERIRSVWPYLVRVARRFYTRLAPREQAQFDLEDIVGDLYCVLLEKDAGWAPERGKYIQYASRVLKNALVAIKERCRTVELPRNAYNYLSRWEADAEGGRPLSAARTETLAALRRALADQEHLGSRTPPDTHTDGGAADEAQGREHLAALTDAVVRAVRDLPPLEALAISRSYGLWGHEPAHLTSLARRVGMSAAKLRQAKIQGLARIREQLEDIYHPALELLGEIDE